MYHEHLCKSSHDHLGARGDNGTLPPRILFCYKKRTDYSGPEKQKIILHTLEHHLLVPDQFFSY